MNEHEATVSPQIIEADPSSVTPPDPHPSKPISWWLRKLFACNPFYLVSAALLLFGCYRVSIDAPMFNLETARLLFNFTAVQVYEVLLVITAIFLSRRAIWYDSTLLVGLENLLVFVPFIFISLAAWIDSQMTFTMCLVGGTVATLRFSSLKRYFHQLNLPGALLGIGLILLLLNIALPLIYRHFGENIIAAYTNSGPAHAMNLRVWMLVLPAMIALANLLPRANKTALLLPQHRWLPMGIFSLWIIVTGVHLYSLGYIYQFDFCYEQTAPALWVLSWTIGWQLYRHFSNLTEGIKYLLLLPPIVIALFAAAPEKYNLTFLILTTLNIAVYCGIWFVDRKHRLVRHLMFISMLLFAAGLPATWLHLIVPGLNYADVTAVGLMAYLLFWAMLLRNPKLALLGSILLGIAIAFLFSHYANGIYWAFQSSFVFLLLHSLRWNDAKERGADAVRIVVESVWLMQSFIWVNSATGKFWMPCIPGIIVLGIYLAAQLLRKQWNHRNVPIAATLVFLSGLTNAAAHGVQTMPAGLLAVIGSFLLFGFGTAAALTKNYWHKPEPIAEAEPSKPASADANNAS